MRRTRLFTRSAKATLSRWRSSLRRPPRRALAEGADVASLADADGRRAAQPVNRARDPYRHPLEVLEFFGVPDNAAVIEILPGASGYWTEILAPYLKAGGRYIAAIERQGLCRPPKIAARDRRDLKRRSPPIRRTIGKVETAEFLPGVKGAGAPAGTADFVLTFRNIHNWMAAGTTDQAFATFFKALKPGGVLGVEEHRGRADAPQDPVAKSGYVRQDYAIALAEAAGFKFVGSSEVNANPKDTKDYPVGVWTLPPTYRLKDQDREKYAAIGESDRFVLKFVKP